MKKLIKAAVLAAAAPVMVAAVSVSPAHAADSYTLNCSTTGASGAVTVNGYEGNITKSFGVILAVHDGAADGHHVRIRLVGKGPGGTPVNWAWHYNYDGEGTTLSWNTTAQYSSGLADVGLQVARYEGDTYLNSCTRWLNSEA
ncbi:hypothetical protein [Streptomyces sp. NBC_01727]|uniref:hypothetical protein n=1 Tax=Streptomyces sp. NBC_01727 TaxID=2975924 RepID=UPI002E0F2A5F|nr:hypothetical protein OIE76_43995 [Streptomyces sp. NBC_01727]